MLSFTRRRGFVAVRGSRLAASASAEPAVDHNHCAARGPDYVEVAGSGRCVRIGEHVHAEMAHESRAADADGGPGRLARALSDGVRGVAETVQGPPLPSAQLYRR